MKNIILCLDIDDCIFPSNQTYFGNTNDAHEILKINMNRIKMMLEKWNIKVFITSAWYEILEIDKNTLVYGREKYIKEGSDFLLDEFEAFKVIRDGLGNNVIGLSGGNRVSDIVKLLKEDNIVIAMDDIGIDIRDQYSKSTDDLDKDFIDNLDYAITLCAEEVCPVLPSKALSLHWMNEDPANDSYSEKQLKTSFSNTRDNLYKLIKKFMIMNVQ